VNGKHTGGKAGGKKSTTTFHGDLNFSKCTRAGDRVRVNLDWHGHCQVADCLPGRDCNGRSTAFATP